MNLSCEIVRDLLPLYCDNACSEESRQAVEGHLQGCAGCREELRLMEGEIKGQSACPEEKKLAEAAARVWKRGKKLAFLRGGLLALLAVALLFGGYGAVHWFSTVDGADVPGLARQAAEYLGYDELFIEETAQRGDYLAALCKDAEGNWCMCVFDRDRVFEGRWYANGGKRQMEKGKLGSWNFGSPEREAVLVFCGGDIPEEVCWYRFQNGGITYTCPVEDDTLLDLFIIPDRESISGSPVPLDSEQRELE